MWESKRSGGMGGWPQALPPPARSEAELRAPEAPLSTMPSRAVWSRPWSSAAKAASW
jgi:hypothetical protein